MTIDLTLYDLAGADRKTKRIAAIARAVELLAFLFLRIRIPQPAGVVHDDRVVGVAGGDAERVGPRAAVDRDGVREARVDEQLIGARAAGEVQPLRLLRGQVPGLTVGRHVRAAERTRADLDPVRADRARDHRVARGVGGEGGAAEEALEQRRELGERVEPGEGRALVPVERIRRRRRAEAAIGDRRLQRRGRERRRLEAAAMELGLREVGMIHLHGTTPGSCVRVGHFPIGRGSRGMRRRGCSGSRRRARARRRRLSEHAAI